MGIDAKKIDWAFIQRAVQEANEIADSNEAANRIHGSSAVKINYNGDSSVLSVERRHISSGINIYTDAYIKN